MSSQPQPQILPCTPLDAPLLAKLESDVFKHDAFSVVAFGALKDTPENISLRAGQIAKGINSTPAKQTEYYKLVIGDEGAEETVGFSCWHYVYPERGECGKDGGEKMEGEKGEEKKEEGNEDEHEENLDDKMNGGWGLSANVKFCEDVFLTADEWMVESTRGKPYAKLSSLLISPLHQRRGYGTLLLSHGLKIADEKGLQCVLGSSPEGWELYKRFGFVEKGKMEIKLDVENYSGEIYVGGGAAGKGYREGEGWTWHGVMWRAAVGGEKEKKGEDL